jgi:hypothetical protein
MGGDSVAASSSLCTRQIKMVRTQEMAQGNCTNLAATFPIRATRSIEARAGCLSGTVQVVLQDRAHAAV